MQLYAFKHRSVYWRWVVMNRDPNHFRGCLIGCAIGDAFGAPVKFMKYEKITDLYGEQGLACLEVNKQYKATITDDTQLTMFTAEGLLRSIVRAEQKKIERTSKDTSIIVFRAYLRWLYTQGLRTPNWDTKSYDGWLVKAKKLHGYREPGVTCLTSLGKGIMGTYVRPINSSKRCGTVIRVAPVGLLEGSETVFDVGCRTGAITHGHPTAYLAAGTLATMIYHIIEGDGIDAAIEEAIEELRTKEDSIECIEAIEKAIMLAKEGNPAPEHLHELGDGFMAHEALAMGIYCILSYPEDFEKGLLLAVNQSGNSNSVAAIYGSVVGAAIGIDQISEQLVHGLDLEKEVLQMADDLLQRYDESEEWAVRYPGW